MEKAIGNPLKMLIVLILAVLSPAKANAASDWTVNPADYQYDMSLYFNVKFAATPDVQFNLDKYDVGAFVGDECRGVAENISLPKGESCLHMRIRSNYATGEEITFKIKDITTGDITPFEGLNITFKSNEVIGLPSDPRVLVLTKYFDVNISSTDGGTVKNGTEAFKNGRYAENTVFNLTAVPDEKYKFAKWSDDVTDATRDITVTDNINLEASFEPNVFTLTYVIDGEPFKTEEITYGSTITPAAAPMKEGYTFSGWEGLPDTMPAEDVTVNGSYSVNSYKLTYIIDGETIATEEIAYGSTITPLTAPEKEGHTFSDWSEIPERMPAKDVTVIGSYSVNSYRLTYILDGDEYRSFDIEFGATITPEDTPMKLGHYFGGWEGLPETMPAHDVEINGHFYAHYYKISYLVDGVEYKSTYIQYNSEITPVEDPEKEGYTFVGWEDLPTYMPYYNVTVNAIFTVNSYKLTYTLDGEEYKTVEVEFGAAITPEAAPVKEGHTFSGWSEMPQTMPANDVTVTGSFTVNSYKLTYTVDGVEYKTSTVEFGAAITPEANPEKEGHTFSGWSEMPQTMPAKDVTVTGYFTINSYKLTYTLDGEEYKTETVEFGAAITPEAAPIKEGYIFSGWSKIPGTMPANDVNVTGTFTVNSYKLTYTLDGEEYKTETVEFGAAITPEANPEKEGHTFSGWSEMPQTMPAKDVTVTGSFTVNSYKLTYILDGEEYKTETVEFGAAITPEANPEKEGHTFSGWSEMPETMPANDVTVNGSFTVNSYKLTYTIDGEQYKTFNVEFGSAITPEANPEKEGHTFSGWSEMPQTMPANDVIVTGSFTVNSYKLTYTVDGVEYKISTVEFGAEITPEAAPEKEGHTFSGWSDMPQTMPANDVTVTGSFTVNNYKLTYTVDGVEYKTSTVEFGSAITPETAPEKEGYTFSGWEELPETMPAHDLTVNGSYKANLYRLTVYLDGEIYLDTELETGAAVEIPTPELPSDKSFNGWIEEIPETMPAHDVEIHGTTTQLSGLTNIFTDESTTLTVYNLRGSLLLRNVTVQEAAARLPHGIYIINGKKILL